jgi:predicted transcriptional regulator
MTTLTSCDYSATVKQYDTGGIVAGMSIDLRLVRTAAGVNQGEVAERLEQSQPWVSKLERHKDFRMSTLADYLDAVGAEAEVTIKVGGQTLTFPIGSGGSS